jgi:aerobic C4-dicarboxylate transport protein
MIRLLSKLYVQLLLGIAAGILVGFFLPNFASRLKPLGDYFIFVIRLLLPPIIFGTVTVGIARMSDLKSVGRVGVKSLVYFEIVSSLALVIGLVVVNIARPGAGMNINLASSDAGRVATYTSGAQEKLLHGLLHNLMLRVILVSVIFGIVLSRLGNRKWGVLGALDVFLHALFWLVRLVMRLAPLAAFGSMAYIVGKYGLRQLLPFGRLIACVYLTCVLFLAGVLGPIAWLCGVSLWRFLRYILDEILVVFGTCSTESVLPQMMNKMEKLGCEEALVGLVLPAGYTFNADGTSIYLTMAAIFIAQATNTPLTLRDQLVVLGVLVLTSKGSAGVAGAGLVTLAATLASMDKIPIAGLALLLGVESLLNQARAVTNVIGNGVATIAIARWEGTFDSQKARGVL